MAVPISHGFGSTKQPNSCSTRKVSAADFCFMGSNCANKRSASNTYAVIRYAIRLSGYQTGRGNEGEPASRITAQIAKSGTTVRRRRKSGRYRELGEQRFF